MKRTWRVVGVLLLSAAAAVGGTVGNAGAATPPSATATSEVAQLYGSVSVQATGTARGTVADPDMLQAPNGKYYTYSTNSASGCGDGKSYHVPLRITDTADLSDACAVKDAMPGGPGSWAFGGTANCGAPVWAPSVIKTSAHWILFYAASKNGSCAGNGQMCIGKAFASSPEGPFKDAGEFACPPAGRWAIDPDAFESDGKYYLVYRDDYVNSYPETGISGVQIDANGEGNWSTRHTLVTSTSITWDSTNISGAARIVENPSMIKVAGVWRLFFSGNNWESARYSTGLANCGSGPVDGACTVAGSTSRPWFGYTSPGGLDPLHGLPGNRKGPGGMDFYTDNAGTRRAVWHFYPDGPRQAKTGVLAPDLTVS